MEVDRRNIILAGAALTAASIFPFSYSSAVAAAQEARFSLGFAPHEGSFSSRGDLLGQIAFAAEQGFNAWEDNRARQRSVGEQEAMARLMGRRGMTMGVFVASAPDWTNSGGPFLGGESDNDREAFLSDITASVEVANRLNAKWMTVVTGMMHPKLPVDIQTGRIIELMRRAGDIAAPHGLVLVMEPLNTRINHPGVFMRTIAQGFAVAKGVNSPAVKVLADVYHEQIQSGNLIPTLELCWSEIAYLQFGDNPARKEPGTGEINYRNIVHWLRGRNYSGVIGMEHGNSLAGATGERKLIAAYRAIDME